MTDFQLMSRLLDSVALSETPQLETGWVEPTSDGGAEILEFPRRRSLFGFARAAVVEAPPAPTTFRTTTVFRRVLPGEVERAAETPPSPAWRTAVSYRRIEPSPVAVAVEHSTVSFEVAGLPSPPPVAVLQEAEIFEPSNIAQQPTLESEHVNVPVEAESAVMETLEQPLVDHADEPGLAAAPSTPVETPTTPHIRAPQGAAKSEPEVIVEPEIVVPDPAAEPAASETVAEDPAATEKTPFYKRERGSKTPKAKRGRRGGGSAKGEKLVGLKVGASQLSAAVVVNDETPEIVRLARTPFESGIVVDGEVRDVDALAASLKSFFADAKLPDRGVRIGVSSNRIGVRTLEIEGVEDDERFANAVRFQAHEVLPIAVSDSVLDYRVLSESTNDAGQRTRRVLLVVAPRDQVEPYVEAAAKAGIKLHGIDLEAFSLLRAFSEPRAIRRDSGEAGIVVASIGHESSTLVVSGQGVCEFTRVFGWGGAALDSAIASACSIDVAEAGAMKTRLSLSGALPEGFGPELAGRALEALRTELTLFARELVSSLQFYQKQPDSLGIGEVLVTGGSSQLDGLAEALHSLVGVPVRVADPLARSRVAKGAMDDSDIAANLGSLAVAIGLGIEDDPVRAVNLVPADVRTSTRRRPALTQVLVPAAVIVPVAAVAAMMIPAKSTVGDRQAELEGLRAELATLPAPKGPGIDQGIKGDQARRAAVVADVLSRRQAWDRVLRDFSLVLPKDVWLTELEASAPTPPPVVAGAAATAGSTPATPVAAPSASGFRLKGRTYSQQAVAKLLARLNTVPTLARVTLTNSAVVKAGTRQVVEFEIAADVRGAGEES